MPVDRFLLKMYVREMIKEQVAPPVFYGADVTCEFL